MDENLPNRVDHLFNTALQQYKTDPAEEVWAKIEEGLDAEDRKIAGYSRRWRRYAAVAVLSLAGLGLLISVYLHQEAIFNRESNVRSKASHPSAIPPATDQAGVDQKGTIHPPAVLMVTAKRLSDHPKNATHLITDFLTAKSDAADAVTAGSDEAPLHTLSAGAVQAPLEVTSPGKLQLPLEQPANPSLSIIHPKERLRDRLSVTPYFSKEFVGYSLTDNDLTGANGQEIEERERNVFSAAVGFFVNYTISKKWVLQTGISYSWSNSNIDSATSYAVIDNHGEIQYKLNTISGYGYLHPNSLVQPNVGDSVYTAKSYSQLHYLTIPLVLSYRVPLKRFSLLIGAGASFNILTSAEIETKTYGNAQPEKEYTVHMMGLKKVNYGMIVKFDLEYRINSSLGVNIIPCFKNTLSPINLEGALSAYPYNFGIGAGLTFHL